MEQLTGPLVPIVGIIFSIGLPLSTLIVYIVLNYRKRRRQMELHHAERMAAIERGMEIPPLPVESMAAAGPRRSTLLPGLIWLLVGIALVVGLHGYDGFTGPNRPSLFGLIPVAVGLAYLIYYFVEGRKAQAHARELEPIQSPKENS